MDKDTRIYLTIGLVVVLVIAGIYLLKNNDSADVKLAKCLGERTELYVKLGCHYCKIQEEMFGNNTQYLNIVDCFYQNEKCIEAEIEGTPTWIINGEKYKGVRSLEQLKELTGC